jgi:2,3-bisphosphoglycerate-independent phosphoglycerate mutase
MKGVLVVLDGVGDLPNKQLDNKTPLEAANTPNLDFFAARSKLGYMYTVKPGFIPESDEAVVSMFGNKLINSTRGQLEASGTDLNLTRGDLALRVNFSTIDSLEKGNVLDRRAGRTLTTAEAQILAKEINKIEMPVKFDFVPTIQHRAVLVFRGGFSDNFLGNDITYFQGRSEDINKITKCKALDEEENTLYSINIVNEFIEKSYEVLKNHPVNQERIKRGLMPANYLMVRGAGIEPPKLKRYKKWVSLNYMPLEAGFAKICGMKNTRFEYPKLKGLDAYENFWKGLKKACKYSIKFLKKNKKKADYAYIHIKETDLPGHDNKPFEKKLMIEYLDITLFKFLRSFASPNKIKIAVTADHSTPCKLKNHSSDPVPVMFYEAEETPLKEQRFSEKDCRKGNLGRIMGIDFIKTIGFDK